MKCVCQIFQGHLGELSTDEILLTLKKFETVDVTFLIIFDTTLSFHRLERINLM